MAAGLMKNTNAPSMARFGRKAAVLLFGRDFDQTFKDSAGKFGININFAAV